jgi:hypothetical protein
MPTMTLNLSEAQHARLDALARDRGTSVTALLDEMTTRFLTDAEAEARFRVRAARGAGRAAEGLALLDKAMANTDM